MTTTAAKAPTLSRSQVGEQVALDRHFCESMSRKDLAGVMECLWNSPNLVVVLFDATVYRGWDAVREAVQQLFDGFEQVELKINEVTHIPLGDGIVAVGTATYRLRAADGSQREIVERWTDLRHVVDGRWVYVLDHAHALPGSL
jgi:ketosteroid isomerase-like protein